MGTVTLPPRVFFYTMFRPLCVLGRLWGGIRRQGGWGLGGQLPNYMLVMHVLDIFVRSRYLTWLDYFFFEKLLRVR